MPHPKFGVIALLQTRCQDMRQPLNTKNHLARSIGEIFFCRKLLKRRGEKGEKTGKRLLL